MRGVHVVSFTPCQHCLDTPIIQAYAGADKSAAGPGRFTLSLPGPEVAGPRFLNTIELRAPPLQRHSSARTGVFAFAVSSFSTIIQPIWAIPDGMNVRVSSGGHGGY